MERLRREVDAFEAHQYPLPNKPALTGGHPPFLDDRVYGVSPISGLGGRMSTRAKAFIVGIVFVALAANIAIFAGFAYAPIGGSGYWTLLVSVLVPFLVAAILGAVGFSTIVFGLISSGKE